MGRLAIIGIWTVVAAGGCGRTDVIPGAEAALRSEQAYAPRIVMAIAANPAGAASPDAYLIAAHVPEGIESGSLTFCAGGVAACTAGGANLIPSLPVITNNRLALISRDPLTLTHGGSITVQARTASGEALVAVATVSAVGTAQPGDSTSPCHKAPDDFVCKVEQEIVRLTNEKRAGAGRGPLAFDPKLGYVARLWSTEQARMGSISHAWFSNGRLEQEYRKEFGESGRFSAENVAMNGGGSTPEAVAKAFVSQWWNSSGHRANMLGGHKNLGVGVARRGSSWYGTQDFGR